MYSSYCSTECQLRQKKPIAWRSVLVDFYKDDAALPEASMDLFATPHPEDDATLRVRNFVGVLAVCPLRVLYRCGI